MKIRTNKGQEGFSLVELMIVVGIIGVLATLAMPRFQQFQAKAKMGEAKNNLSHIFTLQQSYALDNNQYIDFTRYGRNADGTLTCTAPAAAQDLGFQIMPCDDSTASGANEPTPRYGYQVVGSTATAFTAEAVSGDVAGNTICPGKAAHGFSLNQDKEFDDVTTSITTKAMRLCF